MKMNLIQVFLGLFFSPMEGAVVGRCSCIMIERGDIIYSLIL